MPWVIERGGTFHGAGGWTQRSDAALRFDSPEDADDARRELVTTTLAGLAGELHVKELPK